jgi:multiple sugar transport system permease protein
MIPQEALKNSMTAFFRQITMIETTLNPISLILEPIQNWTNMFENGVGFTNSIVPLYILSIFGLGFKNGLFIFMLRQFFKGVPDELEESAFVDGSSTIRTFFSIIIPISIPMLVTVFIFAFSWQWTDDFYTKIFFDDYTKMSFMSTIDKVPQAIGEALKYESSAIYESYKATLSGTASILIALPLIVMYVFLQRRIVEGVERSGIVG